MAKEEVDFALNAFIVTKDRREIGKYLSFDDDEYGLIYITNPKGTFDWKVYTQQYRTEAWIGFWLFFLTIPILLKITSIVRKYYLNKYPKVRCNNFGARTNSIQYSYVMNFIHSNLP